MLRTLSTEEFRVRISGNSKVLPEADDSVVMPLPFQIAGHGSEGDGQRTILKHSDGHVLKPVQKPPRGQREVGFYKSINKSSDPVDIDLRQHIPKFFGVEEVGFVNGVTVTEEFLVLEDVTEGMELPNVMDVKIGSRTWGLDATKKKQVQEDAKYIGTKKPFGFSVLGIIQHSIKDSSLDDDPVKYDKTFGKDLKTEDVLNVPKIFFDVERSGVINALVLKVVKQMKSILEAYKKQKKYKLFASSLLLAYDVGQVRQYLETNDEKHLEKAVRMKLIDFAHVFPSNGEQDENFISGLQNLIQVFEGILNKK